MTGKIVCGEADLPTCTVLIIGAVFPNADLAGMVAVG